MGDSAYGTKSKATAFGTKAKARAFGTKVKARVFGTKTGLAKTAKTHYSENAYKTKFQQQ